MPANYACDQSYTVELLSFDPLVMYVNNFIRDDEIAHVLEVAEDKWADAKVASSSSDGKVAAHKAADAFIAEGATIPPSDPVSQCLTSRVQSLLGNIQHAEVDHIRLVKYAPGGRFRLHSDRYPTDLAGGGTLYPDQPRNRLLSVFAVLDDNCTGGETYFPRIRGVGLDADPNKFWRTGKPDGMGLLVKPVKGNAVVWMNAHANGTRDERVFHAGLPVMAGGKIGMNIFSAHYPHLPLMG